MILQCFSRCSGTQDMKWKSQRVMSRACRSLPFISSSCRRNLTSQVKEIHDKGKLCVVISLLNSSSFLCLALLLVGFKCPLRAPQRIFWNILAITKAREQDVPVKIKRGSERSRPYCCIAFWTNEAVHHKWISINGIRNLKYTNNSPLDTCRPLGAL